MILGVNFFASVASPFFCLAGLIAPFDPWDLCGFAYCLLQIIFFLRDLLALRFPALGGADWETLPRSFASCCNLSPGFGVPRSGLVAI